MDLVFPFHEYWWFYAGFTAFVLLLLALDLGVFHRKAHVVTFRESIGWSVVWIVLALVFNLALYRYALSVVPPDQAQQIGLEFLAGYIVERSLALDNIFVFMLVFEYFAIPSALQYRVLFYGIIGALVFRAAFVALGAAVMQYHTVVLLFGIFLLVTGVKMLWTPELRIEPDRNPIIKGLRRLVPVASELHGQHFIVQLAGKWHATPMLVALIFLEFSDIVFAVDSVPAIFAITREPLIVFTSNVFAILGLRSTYFLLPGAIERFHLLKYALAFVLVFVGLKMVWLNDLFDGKFPIGWSLGIITGILAAGVVASLIRPARRDDVPPGDGHLSKARTPKTSYN